MGVGEFENISAIVNHSVRIFYDRIIIKGVQPKHLKHTTPMKKSIRMNGYASNGSVNAIFFSIAELADHSIAPLMEWRKKSVTGGVIID